jgi:hypothetical protein
VIDSRFVFTVGQPYEPKNGGDLLKAAVSLASQMASSEAQRMLALKTQQVLPKNAPPRDLPVMLGNTDARWDPKEGREAKPTHLLESLGKR